MSSSISVILPVRNLQYGLATRVHRLLEVLSELSAQFEILIIDYGSTDHTPEIAADLAASFPQIRLLDRSDVGDPVAVVEESVAQATGDYILVHDAALPLSQSAMLELWESRDRSESSAGLVASGSQRRIRTDEGTDSLHLMRRSSARSTAGGYTEPPSAFERFTRTNLVRHRETEERLSPNLAARLQRFVSRTK